MPPPAPTRVRPPRGVWRPRRGAAAARALGLLLAVALALAVGVVVGRRATTPAAAAAPRITHDVVLQQVRGVARLATAEATVRDVITYEQSRLLGTKRALLVVTGRVLAGVELDRATGAGGAEVEVDTTARRLRVTLPPAELLSAEVTDVRTYDERAGLFTPFTPADRDAMQRTARERLRQAGRDLRVLELAERHAVTVLQALLARDGWTVEVAFRGRGVPSTPAPAAPGRG